MNKENKTTTLDEYNKIGELLKIEKDNLAKQGNIVREAKQKKMSKEELAPLIEKLKQLQKTVSELTAKWREADPNKLHIDKKEFESLLTRRFFVVPAFEIYGGVAGLYDYGPPACAIKANLLNFWRKHFVIEENMLEMDLTSLTPEIVFQTSGHVEKFADFMMKDEITNECFRADKLLQEWIEQQLSDPKLKAEDAEKMKKILAEVDGYKEKELKDAFTELGVKSPKGNNLIGPLPFNLMFSTQIGPTGKLTGYLRPETAQGLFVNFRRLLDYNGGQMPFAGATIGQAFRNEIAPRSGLLRVREFALAEIEHFCHPKNKDHPKYDSVKDIKLVLFPQAEQFADKGTVTMTIDEAVKKGIINNQTLAYFMGRVYLFMMECGILPEGIRFRQHLKTEMAHYACDCWDCELLTSYGWIECVGIADRACYDLQQHAKKSKAELVAYEEFKEPKIIDFIEIEIDKGKIGKTYRKDAKPLIDYIEKMNEEQKQNFQKEITEKGHAIAVLDGKEFELKSEFVKFKPTKKKISGQNYIPSVIEPSFGIGRIIYCILEHSFWIRKSNSDEEKDAKKKTGTTIARAVLSLSPTIAPYKAVILPQSQNSQFNTFIKKISSDMAALGISHRVDDSGQSIGKRYARADDIGIPFGVTVDFNTLNDNCVTLRERDTCVQVRIKADEVVQVINALLSKRTTWSEVRKKYPEQKQTASELVGKKK